MLTIKRIETAPILEHQIGGKKDAPFGPTLKIISSNDSLSRNDVLKPITIKFVVGINERGQRVYKQISL